MFGKLFGSSNKYDSLKNTLASHEQSSTENLHQNHPHLRGIFDKHNIDLKQIRRKGTKVAAAAAVLGAFLAIPFLLGHPKHQEQPTPEAKTTRAEHTRDKSVLVPGEGPQPFGTGPGATGVSPEARGPETKPDVGGPPGGGGDEEEKSKSKGHLYGRSYLAPPKEHGLHDLGLHKGEGKGKGKVHKGPHPEELEVRHPPEGEKT